MADGVVIEPPVETPRRAGIGGFLVKCAGAIAILIVVALGLMWAAQSYVGKKLSPDPVTIANSSLQGLQEQNRLSAFAARYVAVVTSNQSRLGLTAEMRSEEQTTELQSLIPHSYSVFFFKQKQTHI